MLSKDKLDEIATDSGLGVARRTFGKRGNKKRVCLTESQLAEILRDATLNAFEIQRLRTPAAP